MTDQPQDPQALLARIKQCLAMPEGCSYRDYREVHEALDSYCAENNSIWLLDEDRVPYIKNVGINTKPLYEEVHRHLETIRTKMKQRMNARIEEQIRAIEESDNA